MEIDDPTSLSLKEYDYLLSMPMWSLSEEKVTDLGTQMLSKQKDLKAL